MTWLLFQLAQSRSQAGLEGGPRCHGNGAHLLVLEACLLLGVSDCAYPTRGNFLYAGSMTARRYLGMIV
jgi:hypothetical protein